MPRHERTTTADASEISQSQKDKYFSRFTYYEAYKVKLLETETRMVVAKGWGEQEKEESSCSVSKQFQFCKMKNFHRSVAWQGAYT